MHAGDANVAFAPRAHRVGDGVQRRLQIEDADADTEDIDISRRLRSKFSDYIDVYRPATDLRKNFMRRWQIA